MNVKLKRRKARSVQALREMKITNTRNERYEYPKTKGTDTSEGLVRVGEFADEAEEGEVHGDDDAADGYSQEADHDRLYEGEEVGDG